MIRALWLAALALAIAAPAAAKVDDAELEALVDELRESIPNGMGDDVLAERALAAAHYGRPILARELAEEILARDPDAYTGHFVLGLVLRQAEGNFALALYHFERALTLFRKRHGEPGEDDPWRWHYEMLVQLTGVTQDMDRYEDSLGWFDRLSASYGPDYDFRRGWPLVFLGRHEQARRLATSILETTIDPYLESSAWETLCVLAGEERDVEAAYRACLRSLETAPRDGIDPVRFTNAAESARGALRMDEAERLLLEGAENFQSPSLGSPWRDLLSLYLAQGRSGEALHAMREMFRWRERQPPYIDMQVWSEHDLTAAALLVVAGRPLEAAKLTARALEQPDRTGHNSIDPRQMMAAAATLDRVASLTAAQFLEEEASASGFVDSLTPRLSALRFRLRAWHSGRRAAALLADPRLLSSRIQPYPPGFVPTPEWVDPELVSLLGPGVIAAALTESRARGLSGEEHGYAAVWATEIAARRSDASETLTWADEALARLPRREALLRARVAALGARAALDKGDVERGMALYDLAFQLDPGTIRRLGLALPARFDVAGGAVAEEAARRLRRSPRFSEDAHGFVVRLEGDEERGSACLASRNVVFACAQVTPRAGDDPTGMGRRLARELHRVAFAPRMDLTQADLRSLDGSPVVAGEASDERVRLVLSELIDGGDDETEGNGD